MNLARSTTPTKSREQTSKVSTLLEFKTRPKTTFLHRPNPLLPKVWLRFISTVEVSVAVPHQSSDGGGICSICSMPNWPTSQSKLHPRPLPSSSPPTSVVTAGPRLAHPSHSQRGGGQTFQPPILTQRSTLRLPPHN